MKKRLLLPTVLLALTLLLSACTPPASLTDTSMVRLDPTNPVSLEIWHYYNGPQKTAFDDLVAAFNDTVGLERGIIVESFSQGNLSALSEKVLAAAHDEVGAGELPDIFATYADTAYEVDKLGLLANLDTWFSPEELESYRPEFLAEGRFSGDGSLKIFPIAKAVELMMVNLTDWDLFAKDTGAQLSELATIEGLTNVAEAYYIWSDGKALFGRDAMANYIIVGCQQMGHAIYEPSADGVTLSLDKATFRRLWDNYYIPMVNGWFSSNGRFRSDEATLGDIVALVGSSSATTYFPTQVAVDDFQRYPIDAAFLPAPRFTGGAAYAIQQGAGIAITRASTTKEYAASLFLKWFTAAEQNTLFAAASGGYLPVQNDALNLARIDEALTHVDIAKEDILRMHSAFDAALNTLSTNTMYTPPPFGENIAARSILESSMNDCAKADRETVLARIAAGTSQDEAVAQFATDQQFDTWYTQFALDLEKAVS